jgi:exosome complex RNA-binding protein Rrp42 (RNase PH superfamily)
LYIVFFQVKLTPTVTCCHSIDHTALNHISGAAIDLSSLIVVDGKVCWDLYIDGLVISSDGNLLDTLASAIKVILICLVFKFIFHCNCFNGL